MNDNWHLSNDEECEECESTTQIVLDHIGSKQLTNLFRNIPKIDSQLINSHQYEQIFRDELKSFKTPRLLYRASRDGFSKVNFHKCCDDYLKIVMIVKSKNGDLFGGFTTLGTRYDTENNGYRKDDHSFTFQFEGKDCYIFRLLKEKAKSAICRYLSTYLITFGYFFWICEEGNTQNQSSSHETVSQSINPESRLPGKNRRYFGGINFLVEDLEVFAIIEE